MNTNSIGDRYLSVNTMRNKNSNKYNLSLLWVRHNLKYFKHTNLIIPRQGNRGKYNYEFRFSEEEPESQRR